MKIINNDIKELESHILIPSQTKGIYEEAEMVENKARKYLEEKYNTNDDMIYIHAYLDYLSSLNEKEILKLLYLAKELYIRMFGDKYGAIGFSCFAGCMIEGGEGYSDITQNSKDINEYLLKEFKLTYKYFKKNHKYEIGEYIFRCMRNLGMQIPRLTHNEYYEYWENYNPE
ncbi:hypothetical protein MK079_05350 [Candidatus Gracilibacteria bacterium]|nr:hypothetical protein [Candidatus Gracilibacteria bacterium]